MKALKQLIIYNVTCKIDSARVAEWLNWMRETHIPDVCATGCFVDATILHLKFPVEDEGETFTVQYRCTSIDLLNQYFSEYAPALQREHTGKFGTDVVSFRTILERLGRYAPE